MKAENNVDELRAFFGLLKRDYGGVKAVKSLSREEVCVEADKYCIRNTDSSSIDRIIAAIKHSL